MPLKIGLFLLLLLLAAYCHRSNDAEQAFQGVIDREGKHFDLLIKNGTVIDGTDTSSYRADILVKDARIKFIGLVDEASITVKRIIDATGQVVTPGFIDTHAHGNPLKTPQFKNFLSMGVTTICLGQDGSSPNYEDLNPWMQAVQDTTPGVNIALFVGHGTLRRLSGAGYLEDPPAPTLERMIAILQKALRDGCFGLSTGLEYTPGTYAGDDELLALAKVVGRHDGLIMSHIRNEDDDAIEASLQELLRQGQYCHVHVSHLKVVYGKGADRAHEILSLLAPPNGRSYRITADIYPYNASYTGIGIVFPKWAKPPNDYRKVIKPRRRELLSFVRSKVMARNGPEATLLGTAPYTGKTLADLSLEMNNPFEEVLLDIGPGGASGAYFVMDKALQTQLYLAPMVMVCSDGSPTMHHPRGYGAFAKIIEDYVVRQNLIALERAVYKMTGLPAKTLGLAERGIIKTGFFADLLVFDPNGVKARATYTEPQQLAAGFSWVIVNGQVALNHGIFPKERYGVLLKKRSGRTPPLHPE